MDAPAATIISGCVMGAVAIVTATLSFLNMRKQLENAQREASRNREYQREIRFEQKTISAVEALLVIMHRLQNTCTMTEDDERDILISILWCHGEIRPKIEAVFKAFDGGGDDLRIAAAAEVHVWLLDFVRSFKRVSCDDEKDWR